MKRKSVSKYTLQFCAWKLLFHENFTKALLNHSKKSPLQTCHFACILSPKCTRLHQFVKISRGSMPPDPPKKNFRPLALVNICLLYCNPPLPQILDPPLGWALYKLNFCYPRFWWLKQKIVVFFWLNCHILRFVSL